MIVQACLNGGHPPSYHPAIPVTIRTMLEDGRKVIAAGAREIHLHVRGEDGLETVIVLLRDRIILMVVTTGAGNGHTQECFAKDIDAIVKPVGLVLPDIHGRMHLLAQ